MTPDGPPDGPLYSVEMTSTAAYGGSGGPPGHTGLRIVIRVARPSDAPAALRSLADRLDVNHWVLEG